MTSRESAEDGMARSRGPEVLVLATVKIIHEYTKTLRKVENSEWNASGLHVHVRVQFAMPRRQRETLKGEVEPHKGLAVVHVLTARQLDQVAMDAHLVIEKAGTGHSCSQLFRCWVIVPIPLAA